MVTFHKWMVGAALTLIMVSALGINALLFSARSFQYNLAQLAPATNGVISVDELLVVETQIKGIIKDTEQPRGALLQAQEQIAALDGRVSDTAAQVQAARADITGKLAELEARTGAAVAESAAAAAQDTTVLQGRIQALTARANLAPADQQNVVTLRGAAQQLGDLESQLAAHDAERAALVGQQRLFGGQVAEADRRIIALKQSVVPYETYDAVRSEVLALRSTSPLGFGTALVQGHPTFMSLWLVLLMGALGAILYLFPAYMSRETPVTFAEIIVRLIFGMVTALAFYIVANATLAGLSIMPASAQGATPAATLNPFSVSLIGIIAGVMADDIARWIKNRGSELFGAQQQAAPAGGAPARTPAPNARPAFGDPGIDGVNVHGGPPPV